MSVQIAQLIKCLPCKHYYLSLDFHHSYKSPMGRHTSVTSAMGAGEKQVL